MSHQFYNEIEYYDSRGRRMFSEVVRTSLDYFDICRFVWGDMPNGAEDFQVVELPMRPKGLTHEPRHLWFPHPSSAAPS